MRYFKSNGIIISRFYTGTSELCCCSDGKDTQICWTLQYRISWINMACSTDTWWCIWIVYRLAMWWLKRDNQEMIPSKWLKDSSNSPCLKPKTKKTGLNLTTGTFLLPLNQAIKKEMEVSIVLKYLVNSEEQSWIKFFFLKNCLVNSGNHSRYNFFLEKIISLIQKSTLDFIFSWKNISIQ